MDILLELILAAVAGLTGGIGGTYALRLWDRRKPENPTITSETGTSTPLYTTIPIPIAVTVGVVPEPEIHIEEATIEPETEVLEVHIEEAVLEADVAAEEPEPEPLPPPEPLAEPLDERPANPAPARHYHNFGNKPVQWDDRTEVYQCDCGDRKTMARRR